MCKLKGNSDVMCRSLQTSGLDEKYRSLTDQHATLLKKGPPSIALGDRPPSEMVFGYSLDLSRLRNHGSPARVYPSETWR